MKLIFNAQARHLTNRQLDGMIDDIRRDLGACDQRRRSDFAALAKIRTIQAQRRIMRPNR